MHMSRSRCIHSERPEKSLSFHIWLVIRLSESNEPEAVLHGLAKHWGSAPKSGPICKYWESIFLIFFFFLSLSFSVFFWLQLSKRVSVKTLADHKLQEQKFQRLYATKSTDITTTATKKPKRQNCKNQQERD